MDGVLGAIVVRVAGTAADASRPRLDPPAAA